MAAVLAFLLGSLGVHRFYLGYTSTGVAMLLITLIGSFVCCGLGAVITGVWSIVDFVLILTGSLKEANGRDLE